MKITTILKRDGRKQKYDRGKISVAIWKALYAVERANGKFRKLPIPAAAETTVSKKQLDKTSSEWKEAERLAEIVEDTLINSNGSHRWKVEEIQDVVEQVLLAAGHENAARAYILYRNRRSAARQVSDLPERSDTSKLGMTENALAAMARRYLRKDKDGKVVETPKRAMERVAAAVAAAESEKESEKVRPWRTPRSDLKTSQKFWQDKYLEIMTSFEFVPAGCYFRGAGNKQNGSLANCFVLPVEDSIAKIFDAVKWSALIHAAGGGTGFNFSHLRPRGDLVKGGGLASGPINFMKAFDAETQIVMQGGVHRGANMGILNVDHPDIFEFIRAKSVDGEVSNFNISVGVFDRFMKAVKQKDWELVNPRDKSTVQKIPARGLWDEIIRLAHASGDPGMIYLDNINRVNPMAKSSLGPIESTNVCGEVPLYPFEVCNLGSINLAKFVRRPFWTQISNLKSQISKPQLKTSGRAGSRSAGQNYRSNINWKRLEEVVRAAVRFLDDGIDASTYPIPQIADMAHKLRRIGLGVMGWADILVKLGVRYDSDEGIKLAESIMKFIQKISWDESEKLAKEKAEFPLWKQSYFNSVKNPFDRRRKVRNVAVTTIAPTGTISMVADCSSGIEPYFALEYTKNVVEKEGLKYVNKYYQEAYRVMVKLTNGDQQSRHFERAQRVEKSSRAISISSRESGARLPRPFGARNDDGLADLNKIFRTAHQISPGWHVRMQAAFQKYTDNAVSKTINFSGDAAVSDIEKAYMLAWKLGCKGITVYRDGSKEGQILENNEQETRNNEGGAKSKKQKAKSKRLVQSQMKITPLSQRAYQVERQQITDDMSDGHCPECGAVMTMEEGCSTCHSCGYSKCSI